MKMFVDGLQWTPDNKREDLGKAGKVNKLRSVEINIRMQRIRSGLCTPEAEDPLEDRPDIRWDSVRVRSIEMSTIRVEPSMRQGPDLDVQMNISKLNFIDDLHVCWMLYRFSTSTVSTPTVRHISSICDAQWALLIISFECSTSVMLFWLLAIRVFEFSVNWVFNDSVSVILIHWFSDLHLQSTEWPTGCKCRHTESVLQMPSAESNELLEFIKNER